MLNECWHAPVSSQRCELVQTAVRVEAFVDLPPLLSEREHKSIVSCFVCFTQAWPWCRPSWLSPGKRVSAKACWTGPDTHEHVENMCDKAHSEKASGAYQLILQRTPHISAHRLRATAWSTFWKQISQSTRAVDGAGFDDRFKRAEILKRFCCHWSCLSASFMDK